MADDNRTDKRITCPACKGNKTETWVKPTLDDMEYDMVQDMCHVCGGLGEVCVCPVCDGTKICKGKSCHACSGNGWIPVDGWDKTVDKGHERLMEEHRAEQEETTTRKPSESIVRLVIKHREAMNSVMREWEKLCSENMVESVDAGAFGRVLGGMTVEFLKQMEEEMKIDRHQVFARFVNGMLEYMESRGDAKGIGIVAGQSGECYMSTKMMDAPVDVKKEEMN